MGGLDVWTDRVWTDDTASIFSSHSQYYSVLSWPCRRMLRMTRLGRQKAVINGSNRDLDLC